MTDQSSEGLQAKRRGARILPAQIAVLCTVCGMIVCLYGWTAKSGWLESLSRHADQTFYNLLVQGFRNGQLDLKQAVPPGLAQLNNPYDPDTNSPYLIDHAPLLDLSLYQHKFYLYFGVTPALVLFWPYHALTGHYLLHKHAVVFFFSMGFLAGSALLWSLWRRCFCALPSVVVVAGLLALGALSFIPAILRQSDVHEVAISCGYAMTLLTLLVMWTASHQSSWRVLWLAAASVAYALAVGARPALLLGAIILLMPVVQAWRGRTELYQQPPLGALLLAAVGPFLLLGLGLLFYNTLRFRNPLEFGQTYQLNAEQQASKLQFSLAYFWFNFRAGFLAPAQWHTFFPFVQDIALPPLPQGSKVEHPFGILANVPFAWLALAAPLWWFHKPGAKLSDLRRFAGALALLFGSCAFILCLHNSICLRYEVEYASALVLLAILGVFGLEGALIHLAGWRRALRWGWGLLLAFSTAFNFLVSVTRQAEPDYWTGNVLLKAGRTDEAIVHFRKALEILPEFLEALNNLGTALVQQGRLPEAMDCYARALRARPDFAEAHYNLGKLLFQQGRLPQAIAQYEQTLVLRPSHAHAHNDLGVALFQQGSVSEAIGHLEQALRLSPDDAEAHDNLGKAFFQLGRMPEAIVQFEQMLRLRPADVEARNNLGTALFRLGKIPEAVAQFEQALRLSPEHAKTRNNLAVGLLQWGEGSAARGRWLEAVAQYQRVVDLKPDDAAAHDSLGSALSRLGRFREAVAECEKALAIEPRLGSAQRHVAWLLATCPDQSIRNGTRAVELAERANQVAGGKDAATLDTLAAAYAEASRFEDAAQTAQAALELVEGAGLRDKVQQIHDRLQLYQTARPYREGAGDAR